MDERDVAAAAGREDPEDPEPIDGLIQDVFGAVAPSTVIVVAVESGGTVRFEPDPDPGDPAGPLEGGGSFPYGEGTGASEPQPAPPAGGTDSYGTGGYSGGGPVEGR